MSKKQSRYSEERNRIKFQIKELERQGYIFETQLDLLTQLQLKEIGIKGTELAKETRKLKQIDRDYLISLTTQANTKININEDITFFDNVVLSNFKAHVNQFNERASSLINNWLNQLSVTHSDHDIATMLNNGAENGVLLNYTVVYSNEKLVDYISEMLDYLPETTTLFKEELMDALEFEMYEDV